MAEKDGTAQNKLGELFVDIGANGLGTLLKGLNSVSATFMLTTKAAQAFTQPIINMAKQSANTAVGIAQMGASLGTTAVEAMKLQTYFKRMHLSGLENELGALSKTFTDIQMGVAGVSGDMAFAFNQLGLEWQDYNGSLESTLQLVKDVQKAVQGMDATEARSYLNKIGMSDKWLYAFQRGNFNISDAMAISDAEIKELIGLYEDYEDFLAAEDRLKMKGAVVVSKGGGKKILNTATNVVNDLTTQEGAKRVGNSVLDIFNPFNENSIFAKEWQDFVDFAKTGQNAREAFAKGDTQLGVENLQKLGFSALTMPLHGITNTSKALYDTYNAKLNANSVSLTTPYVQIQTNGMGQATGGAAGYQGELPDLKAYNPPALGSDNSLAALPPNMNQMSYTINVNNNNNISGNNATEIANQIAEISSDDIKYSQYQAHNLPIV